MLKTVKNGVQLKVLILANRKSIVDKLVRQSLSLDITGFIETVINIGEVKIYKFIFGFLLY